MGGFYCTRSFLIIINILYLMISVVLIAVAAYSRLASIIGSLTIVGGIIACGVFLMLISVLGIIGAVHHHQIALFFYMIIIFLIFLIQFSVAVACLAVTEEQQHKLLSELWHQASDPTRNDAQYQFNCCGFDNQTAIDLGEQHPTCEVAVCCQNGTTILNHPCCQGNKTSMTNSSSVCPCQLCYKKIMDKTERGFKLTGGLGLFFAFLEFFGIWLSHRYRNLRNPAAQVDIDNYRPSKRM